MNNLKPMFLQAEFEKQFAEANKSIAETKARVEKAHAEFDAKRNANQQNFETTIAVENMAALVASPLNLKPATNSVVNSLPNDNLRNQYFQEVVEEVNRTNQTHHEMQLRLDECQQLLNL